MTGTGTGSRTAAHVAPVASGTQLGRYQLLAKLASGGMATVFLARIGGVGGFERRVAIKVLHPHLSEDEQIRDMFLDEARLAARIRHPNVVPVTDVGDEPGHGTFLVMDYIEGCDLSKVIRGAARAQTMMAPTVVARIVYDMLGGLTAAHELTDQDGQPLGVVHRDISPHNVIVGVDGIARITDFGIAKAEGRISSTKTGQLKGKLAYMPPERLASKKSQRIDDHRGDLFATAIVLFEALTCRRLFRGEDDLDTVRKVLQDDIPLVSSIRPELAPFDEVVRKGLERDPHQRFQSAREFREELERAVAPLGGIGRPEQVTALLRGLVGSSLDRQREAVAEAVRATEAGQGPPPTGSFVTAPSEQSQSHSHTAIEARKAPNLWMGVALVLLVAIAGLGTYIVGRMQKGDEPPPETAGPPTTLTAVQVTTTPTETETAETESAETETAETETGEAETETAETETAETETAEAETAETEAAAETETAQAETTSERTSRGMRRRTMDASMESAMEAAETMEAAMTEPAMTMTMTTAMDEVDVLENPYAN